MGTEEVLIQRCECQRYGAIKQFVIAINLQYIDLHMLKQRHCKEPDWVGTAVMVFSCVGTVRPLDVLKHFSETGPVSFLRWGRKENSIVFDSLEKPVQCCRRVTA